MQRHPRFGLKLVRFDIKSDKSGTFLENRAKVNKKTDLKTSQICPIWCQSVRIGGQIGHPFPWWARWAKCTEIWSEKVPDLSNLGPIWPTLEPNLPSLFCHFQRLKNQGRQIWTTYDKLTLKRDNLGHFLDSFRVHYDSTNQNLHNTWNCKKSRLVPCIDICAYLAPHPAPV